MRFQQAIVRIPSPELVHGLTTVDLGEPDYKTAMAQYEGYLKALTECGLQVGMLAADNHYPDSCFVEDVALCTPSVAIITRPGATSRRGEIEGMEEALKPHFEQIERIEGPGTVEGGDVMMVGDHFYVGLSDRTNEAGALQLIAILERYGMSGSVVHVPDGLHLKSGVSYLENNTLLAVPGYTIDPQFKDFKLIEVNPEEAYAANSLWINRTVLVPDGFPDTLAKIEAASYATLVLPMREFQKIDGGLSCLSLRF